MTLMNKLQAIISSWETTYLPHYIKKWTGRQQATIETKFIPIYQVYTHDISEVAKELPSLFF